MARLNEVVLDEVEERLVREKAERELRRLTKDSALTFVVHDSARVTAYSTGDAWVGCNLLVRMPAKIRKTLKKAKVA